MGQRSDRAASVMTAPNQPGTPNPNQPGTSGQPATPGQTKGKLVPIGTPPQPGSTAANSSVPVPPQPPGPPSPPGTPGVAKSAFGQVRKGAIPGAGLVDDAVSAPMKLRRVKNTVTGNSGNSGNGGIVPPQGSVSVSVAKAVKPPPISSWPGKHAISSSNEQVENLVRSATRDLRGRTAPRHLRVDRTLRGQVKKSAFGVEY